MNILVPISLGELYDKVSILEIKKDFIKDQQKLDNIDKELSKLLKIFIKQPLDKILYDQLKTVNLEIWYIEDQIRLKEKNKEFDDKFISYARKIYEKNDERATIKKEINLKYSSNIIEEKSYEKY